MKHNRAMQRAGAYRENPDLERLIAKIEADPNYDPGPNMRIQIGFYQSAKEGHAAAAAAARDAAAGQRESRFGDASQALQNAQQEYLDAAKELHEGSGT